MNNDLAGRVIVVTGGGGLLGTAFAAGIADSGGVAVIADIDESRAADVQRALTSEGSGRCIDAVAMDITSGDSIDSAISTLMSRHGRIDGLVNNAYPRNASYGRRLEDVTYADFTENLGMHVGGYFLTSQRFVRAFREQGSGIIVNMGSIYGVMAPRFDVYKGTTMTMPVEYAAIKSAITHLTRYFAQYLKGSNIRVNCLSPGGILDQQAETFVAAYREYAADKGMLEPRDLVGALIFLLSDRSRYINGQNIVVDDAWSV